jgi:uncharacterized protein (UPF0332 family)
MILTPDDYLARADEDIAIASSLSRDGHIRASVSRSYYAMFYTATALLYSKELAFKKHSAVVAGFGHHFAATGEMDARFHAGLRKAFDLRLKADYELAARLAFDEAEEQLAIAREFIQAAREYLAAHQPTD